MQGACGGEEEDAWSGEGKPPGEHRWLVGGVDTIPVAGSIRTVESKIELQWGIPDMGGGVVRQFFGSFVAAAAMASRGVGLSVD